MQKTVSLKAQKRSGKASQVRAGSFVPAECYGVGKDNLSIKMNYQDFRKAYIKAGDNTIIELDVDGDVNPVLVHDVQFDPIKDTVTHVDFKYVDMTVEVVANIPVVLTGVSPAVKEQAGVLNQTLAELEVKCLPADLPHEFVVDISSLVDFHTVIHVSDVEVPEKVEILNAPEQTVVTVSAPRAEEEPEQAPEMEEPEVIGEEKAEGGEE